MWLNGWTNKPNQTKLLHQCARSHIYKDTTGLAYMVTQMKEDPSRLAFSTLMSLIFYVLQPCKMSFLFHTNYGYGEPLQTNMKFSYKHLILQFQKNLLSRYRDEPSGWVNRCILFSHCVLFKNLIYGYMEAQSY